MTLLEEKLYALKDHFLIGLQYFFPVELTAGFYAIFESMTAHSRI